MVNLCELIEAGLAQFSNSPPPPTSPTSSASPQWKEPAHAGFMLDATNLLLTEREGTALAS